MDSTVNPENKPFVSISTENHLELDVALFASKLKERGVVVTDYWVRERTIEVRWPTSAEERRRCQEVFDYYRERHPNLEFESYEPPDTTKGKPNPRAKRNHGEIYGGGRPLAG